ncbi:MAG: HEAT repeat domain-containing protein [Herpetosiphon sp.]
MSEIENLLNKLGDLSRPFKHRDLRGFSDLGVENETELLRQWSLISASRRQALASAMHTLAEDSVEFDFRDAFSAFLEDQDPKVRQIAADGLWEDNRLRTLRRVLEILGKEQVPEVRASLALTLGHFAYMAACNELPESYVTQIRATLLAAANPSNPDVDVRRRALESVAYFSGSDVTSLIQAAYGTGDPLLKQSVLAAIGHNLDGRWLTVLKAELRSDVPALRFEAARAAGEFGVEALQVVPQLAPLTSDDDLEVATAAIWALGQIGGRVAQQRLSGIVRAGDDRLQEAAEEALSELRFNADASLIV